MKTDDFAGALEILLELINTSIATLNEKGYNLHDYDNPEYFLESAAYSEDDDKIYLQFKEMK